MFQKILVPLDGSDLAEEALKAAIELAEKFDSQLILLTVLLNIPKKAARDFRIKGREDEFEAIREEFLSGGKQYLDEMREKISLPNDRIVTQLVDAVSPADGILDVCEQTAADSIVMSTHGRSGINRWVFGSVAEKVLRGANVPVVLLPSR